MKTIKWYHSWRILFFLSILVSTQAQEDAISDGTYRRISVPILMYHYVSELPDDADDIRRGLTVSPAQFRIQIDYLKREGYETISFEQLEAALNRGESLPTKPVILSFDDGHRDHFDIVYPILREVDYIGTFFIITGFTDRGMADHLTWDEITFMANDGMDIQPHTKNHIDLRERSYETLIYEIIGSRESITHYTGSDAIALAYPVGRYDSNLLEFLATTEIRLAVTTEPGRLHYNTHPYLMPRLRVTENMGVSGIAQLLNSGR